MNRTRLDSVILHAPVPRSWKRAWWRRRINEHYAPIYEQMAHGGADGNELNDFNSEWGRHLAYLEEEVELEMTDALVRKAEKLRLPVPPRGSESGFWQVTGQTDMPVLSDDGIRKLRDEIRTELKWRREQRAHWLTFMSVVTGVIGAITGLVALLMK